MSETISRPRIFAYIDTLFIILFFCPHVNYFPEISVYLTVLFFVFGYFNEACDNSVTRCREIQAGRNLSAPLNCHLSTALILPQKEVLRNSAPLCRAELLQPSCPCQASLQAFSPPQRLYPPKFRT